MSKPVFVSLNNIGHETLKSKQAKSNYHLSKNEFNYDFGLNYDNKNISADKYEIAEESQKEEKSAADVTIISHRNDNSIFLSNYKKLTSEDMDRLNNKTVINSNASYVNHQRCPNTGNNLTNNSHVHFMGSLDGETPTYSSSFPSSSDTSLSSPNDSYLSNSNYNNAYQSNLNPKLLNAEMNENEPTDNINGVIADRRKNTNNIGVNKNRLLIKKNSNLMRIEDDELSMSLRRNSYTKAIFQEIS
jgi:hypothetical protein